MAICVTFTAKVRTTAPTELMQKIDVALSQLPGYLGKSHELKPIEKNGKSGLQEITKSYWKNKQAIEAWAHTPIHSIAKKDADFMYYSYRIEVQEDVQVPDNLILPVSIPGRTNNESEA